MVRDLHDIWFLGMLCAYFSMSACGFNPRCVYFHYSVPALPTSPWEMKKLRYIGKTKTYTHESNMHESYSVNESHIRYVMNDRSADDLSSGHYNTHTHTHTVASISNTTSSHIKTCEPSINIHWHTYTNDIFSHEVHIVNIHMHKNLVRAFWTGFAVELTHVCFLHEPLYKEIHTYIQTVLP